LFRLRIASYTFHSYSLPMTWPTGLSTAFHRIRTAACRSANSGSRWWYIGSSSIVSSSSWPTVVTGAERCLLSCHWTLRFLASKWYTL
jgi:hypothetical protein